MAPASDTTAFDVLLIGSGLGATAAARSLAQHGMQVAIVPGVGRSRSLESDGGLVDARLVERAFGAGAPLGRSISSRQHFIAESVTGIPEFGAIESMAPRQTFRRLELEKWAREQAIEAGAVYLERFIEGVVLPASDGQFSLTEDAGEGVLRAGTIILCEGSDPRIAMRAGLRPDYSPEEQIHFARTILAQPMAGDLYRSGRSRTSWGMPIGITIIPLGATTLLAVDTRIENVMRSTRSTQEALLDLLSSRLGNELRLGNDRIHTGIELTALRRSGRDVRLSQERLLVGLDASGMMDTREARRADVTIGSGLHLAAFLSGSQDRSWDQFALPELERIRAVNPRFHDSHGTGFIEDSEGTAGLFGPVTQIGKSILGRWRRRA